MPIIDMQMAARAVIDANTTIMDLVEPAPDFLLVSHLEIDSTAIRVLGATPRSLDPGTTTPGGDYGHWTKFLSDLLQALLDNTRQAPSGMSPRLRLLSIYTKQKQSTHGCQNHISHFITVTIGFVFICCGFNDLYVCFTIASLSQPFFPWQKLCISRSSDHGDTHHHIDL